MQADGVRMAVAIDLSEEAKAARDRLKEFARSAISQAKLIVPEASQPGVTTVLIAALYEEMVMDYEAATGHQASEGDDMPLEQLAAELGLQSSRMIDKCTDLEWRLNIANLERVALRGAMEKLTGKTFAPAAYTARPSAPADPGLPPSRAFLNRTTSGTRRVVTVYSIAEEAFYASGIELFLRFQLLVLISNYLTDAECDEYAAALHTGDEKTLGRIRQAAIDEVFSSFQRGQGSQGEQR